MTVRVKILILTAVLLLLFAVVLAARDHAAAQQR